jgi:hypothetical protein
MSAAPTVTLVGEDKLCCQLGVRLLSVLLPTWQVAPAPIVKAGITKLVPELPRYAQVARFGSPVLCVADTDGQCPATLIDQWWPARQRHARMLLRLAVTEAESWLLADHDAMKMHFKVPSKQLPGEPDALDDPKATLLQLVHRHAPATLRREMVELDRAGQPRRSTGYSVHLEQFVAHVWVPARAEVRSPSLGRAMTRLAAWPALAGGQAA